MTYVPNVLIWLHLVGFALGSAGGIGMSLVAPRLVAAGPDQAETWWPLAKGLARMAGVGLALLLVTGPLAVWLKYAGGGGLGAWFWAKMALVAVMVVTFGLDKIGMARLKRGDASGARLMMAAGPLTGIVAFAVTLCAVFAFG